MMKTRRVTVVGAGVPGLAIAIQLRQRGWDVTVLEKEQPGAGTSSAALGNLTPYSDHECSADTRALAEKSLASYPEWLKELEGITGIAVDYDVPGVLEVAFTEAEAEALQRSFRTLVSYGAPVELVSRQDALRIEKGLSPKTTAGLCYTSEATLDVGQLITACTMALDRLGCSVSTRTLVYRVLQANGRVIGVETSQGRTLCDALVLAPGTDLELIQDAPKIPLERVRGEALEVRGAPGVISHLLYRGDGFITPRRDGRIYLGSNYDVQSLCDDETRTTIRAGTALQTLEATIEIVPGLKDLQLQRVWKGWRPRTPDRQPVIGRSELDGAFVAVGFYGLGITLAPAVAEAIARLLEGESPGETSGLGLREFNSPSGPA